VTHYDCRHFSISNALDDRPDDLPYLMRRMADAIEAEGITGDDILDLTVSNEIHEDVEDGCWWSMTVYWSKDRPSS
jgi:hypothetical protein